MKKKFSLGLMVLGLGLMVVFGYIASGFLGASPLLQWTLFTGSMILTLALFILGGVLLGVGLVLRRRSCKASSKG